MLGNACGHIDTRLGFTCSRPGMNAFGTEAEATATLFFIQVCMLLMTVFFRSAPAP